MGTFKLTDSFIEPYKKKPVKWGSLGLVTYTRTYARVIPEEDRKKKVATFLKKFKWTGPVFEISALTGLGCDKLCYALQDYLDSLRHDRDQEEERAADPRYQVDDKTQD